MAEVEIREAGVEDAALILRFITDLARYEKAEHEVSASLAEIEHSLFGPKATAKALVFGIAGEAIGYAVYFFNYSTWLGKPGLYLEDLYVSPEHRGKGTGRSVLQHLAKIAVVSGCGRFEWSVLDWNEPAIRFYKSLGAEPQAEWVAYRLDGTALTEFASA
ncbi:MAG: GNAT family N-acetyltransferase [Planctomycetota bacterium]